VIIILVVRILLKRNSFLTLIIYIMSKNETHVTKEVKAFRIEIDTMMNSIGLVMPSREVSLAYTNLQRAKMWLGKCLQYIGNPDPYPESKDPKSATIEPSADHENNHFGGMFEKLPQTQTARVKYYREVITNLVDEMKKQELPKSLAGEYTTYFKTAYMALEEAVMWFGWELGRIKILQDNKDKEMGSAPALQLEL
jgi:hypothetical protein